MIRAASTLSRVGVHRRVASRLPAHAAPLNSYSQEETQQTYDSPSLIHGIANVNMSVIQKRFMSSDSNPPKEAFDETMDKMFAQKEAQAEGDAWFLDDAATEVLFEPKWWNLADHAVSGVHFLHDMTGLHYAGSIFLSTVFLRVCIFPLAVRGQRAASRMAHLQPELAVIKKRYETLGTPSQAEQKAFAEQMKSLFARYEVKPFASLAAPFIQAPVFIGMFFGMKKMPDLFPDEMATGGIMWFTDLTIPDPLYVLPLTCGLSFLATIESGKEQMIDSNQQYGPVMVNAFRAMAVVMVPAMTTFPAAMLCYWVPNNLITLVQSVVLRNTWVKKQFGIWDRPKPLPGTNTNAGFAETIEKLTKQVKGEPTTEAEVIKRRNDEIDAKKRVQQMSKATKARRRERR